MRPNFRQIIYDEVDSDEENKIAKEDIKDREN
jgi:hypothetical protein